MPDLRSVLAFPAAYRLFGRVVGGDGSRTSFVRDHLRPRPGDRVLDLFREGRVQEVNDYCLCDTLDTYFVFLRTRVFTGDILPEQEEELIEHARALLESKAAEYPVLRKYLDGWAAVE